MQQVTCDEIYITPSNQPCQAESVMGMQCLTLQQYASSSNLSITTSESLNETLILIQGTHDLRANLTISGNNWTAFEMHGTNAAIHCSYASDDEGFYIQDLQYTSISGISFSGCKNVYFQSVHTLMIANNAILQLPGSNQSPLSYWNLSRILNATILRMSFCCRHILQVEWSSLTIKQSAFSQAVAHVNHTDIVIIRSNFTENLGVKSAVQIDNGYISIHESLFVGTQPTIRAALHVISKNNTISIRNSSFMNNQGRNRGGALHVSGNNLSVLISESQFKDNSAGSGGAIYIEGFSIHLALIDSVINDNTANFCGALNVEGSEHNIYISRSIFDSNEADTVEFELTDAFINNCSATCFNSSTITISSSNFSRNSVNLGHGGAICMENSTLYVQGCTFTLNEADPIGFGGDINRYNGGVIYSEYSSVDILINESSFISNRASRDGGVIYIGMADSQVRIISSCFDHNCAGKKGQIISIHGSQLDIEDTNINTNVRVTSCLCGVINSCMSNVTIDIQENFTKQADPKNLFCTLYDIESTYHPIDSTGQNLLPPYPDIQPETSSQTVLAVSLTLLVVMLLLMVGITITGIILYRQGKLKFKKWPRLFVNNPCLYVPMNNTDTSIPKVE